MSDLRSDFDALRTEMTEEFKNVRREVKDGFIALKNEIGGLHNRIDNETFARKDLEQRVRRVVPKLPEAA